MVGERGMRTQDIGDDVEDGDEGGERGVEPSARAGAFHCGTFALALVRGREKRKGLEAWTFTYGCPTRSGRTR